MDWVNLIITFLPLVLLAIFFGYLFKGRLFGQRTYNQMMDESFQRLDRMEGHLARMAVSLEQIAAALPALRDRQPTDES